MYIKSHSLFPAGTETPEWLHNIQGSPPASWQHPQLSGCKRLQTQGRSVCCLLGTARGQPCPCSGYLPIIDPNWSTEEINSLQTVTLRTFVQFCINCAGILLKLKKSLKFLHLFLWCSCSEGFSWCCTLCSWDMRINLAERASLSSLFGSTAAWPKDWCFLTQSQILITGVVYHGYELNSNC